MNRLRTIIAFLTFLSPLLTYPDDGKGRVSNDRIGLYQVDLVCPAAPLIGCGSAAKPLLLQLEHSTNVNEAWLNRAGTIIAVVWKEDASKKRAKTLASALGERKALEVKGEARQKTLREFLSGNGWFRGADVDRLSEEEAGIIAGRLVRRINKQIPLSAEKSKALEAGISTVIKRKLTSGEGENRSQLEEEILEICRQHLNENEIVILKKAREEGAFAHLREE